MTLGVARLVVFAALVTALPCVAAVARDVGATQSIDQIAQASLERVLQQQYPNVSDWSVEPVMSCRERCSVPEGAPVEARVQHVGARSSVRVHWREPSGAMFGTVVWFSVMGSEQTVTAARDITAGESLIAADATLAHEDVFNPNCARVTAPQVLRAMRAKRGMRRGSPICAAWLERQPAVGRGEKVAVHFESQRVALLASGIAQQDAEIGQRLKVLNPHSKQSFIAVVSARHEVTVHE